MRSNESIKITMKIPFPINEPDRNGTIYTKEAVEKAVQEFNSGVSPMMVKDEIGTVIGHIEKLELSDNYEVTAHGICYFSGTCDEKGYVQDNIVTDFKFLSFGIRKGVFS